MDKYIRWKKPTPRDSEYVSAYLMTHSQIKAAELCGVGRETIARAVRRANIKLDGTKYNCGVNNPKRKITDSQLSQDVKTLNCREIAIKYDMGEENVFRRARKLGLKVDTKGSGKHCEQRAYRYGVELEKGITLKALIKRDQGICQICGLPTDVNDIKDGHIRRNYPTIDHIIPLSKGGTHTWGNIQLAHMSCNSGKCDKLTYHGKKRREV